jgi:hypothetical protein
LLLLLLLNLVILREAEDLLLLLPLFVPLLVLYRNHAHRRHPPTNRDKLNPEMIASRKIGGWKALAFLAAIFALILLLLPQAANHHAATLFLLVPIFLFVALVEQTCTYQPPKNHVFALNHHVRSTLFQRPPPSQA